MGALTAITPTPARLFLRVARRMIPNRLYCDSGRAWARGGAD
jgi:hypothetical protein